MAQETPEHIDRWFIDNHPELGTRIYRLEKRGTVLALYCNDKPVVTPPKPLELLEQLLLPKFGTPIEKAAIMDAVWPDAALGGDLHGLIGDLRTLLLDSQSPAFPKWRLVKSGVKNALRFGGHEVPEHQRIVLPDQKPSEPDAAPIRLRGLNDFPRVEKLKSGDLLRLLDPTFRAFDVAGRKHDSEILWDWLQGDSLVSLQVLVGHGGRGKTRLAIHLLEMLQERCRTPWHAGFLDEPLSGELFRRWESASPTLLIIDECSRLSDVLSEEVIPHLRRLQPELPLRVLLIDRGADEIAGWYRKVLTAGRILFPNPPFKLLGLDAHIDSVLTEREQLLESALTRLSQFTGQPKPAIDDAARARLASTEMGDPLILCMAAVVGCKMGDLSALAWRRIQLAEYLADREEERILHLAKSSFLPIHMTAYVSLCGGLTASQLLRTCDEERSAVQATSPWDPLELAQLIGGTVLPPQSISPVLPESVETQLAAQPIVPDIVCEVFIERVFRDPYQHPAETIRRAFRQKPGAVVRTLVHMVQDFGVVEGDDSLPRQKRALDWLASLLQSDVESLSPDDLWQINSALPDSESVALAEVAHQFYQTVLGIPQLPDWLSALAMAHLARWEHHLGNDAESLRLSTYAVQKYQELVDAYSDFYFVEEFCKCLTGHVNALGNNGFSEEAFKTSLMAVQLCREVQAERGGFLWALAPALVLHASAWDHLGQRDKALEAVSEAIQLYRDRLLATNRDAYLSWLAIALRDQSSYCHELGQASKALEAAKEALSYYQELARLQPDTYQPRLARAIQHHANMYRSHWDDPNSAKLVIPWFEESIAISRDLLVRNRRMFLHDAAGIIFNSGIAFHAVPGRESEGEELVEEAEGYFSELVERNPTRYAEALIVCQTARATNLREAGKSVAALELIDRTIDDARTRHTQGHPNSALRLWHAIGTKAHVQQAQGCGKDALMTILEAVGYGKELVRLNPGRYLQDLARTYYFFGHALLRLGEIPQAIDSFADALRHIKAVGLRYPEAHGNFAGTIATQYATTYAGLHGRFPDAGFTAPFTQYLPENDGAERLRLLRESFHQTARHQLPSIAKFYREQASVWGEPMMGLAEEVMQRHASLPENELAAGTVILKERASVLMARVQPWREAGYVEEALASVREAIPLQRLLAQEDPLVDNYKAALAFDLFTEGQILHQLGRTAEALEPIEEATSRLGALTESGSDDYRQGLLSWLPTQLRLQYDLGHKPRALETARTMVSLAQAIADREPDAFPEQLVQWLTCQQELQAELGQPLDGAQTAAEVAAILRRFLFTNREKLLPELWRSLNKQAALAESAEQHKSLVEPTKESVAVLRDLVAIDSDTYSRHLPHALYVYATALVRRGGDDENAVLALEEAFEHFRRIAQSNPEWLKQDAQDEVIRESATLWCRLIFRRKPDQCRDKISEQLRLFAQHVSRFGDLRPIESPLPLLRAGYILACRRTRSKRDLDVLAPLAVRFPPYRQSVPIGLFIPNHANSQQRVEISLRDAREQIEAALAVDRQRLRGNSEDNLVMLGDSLHAAARVHAELKATRRTLKYLREAEDCFRSAAEIRPAAHRSTLATALRFNAEIAITLGEKQLALESIAESVQICRELLKSDDSATSGLAFGLDSMATVQQKVGKKLDAVDTRLEAIGHYLELASREPSTYASRLRDSVQPFPAQIKYKVFVWPISFGQCPMAVRVSLPAQNERIERALELLNEHIGKISVLTASNPDLFLQSLADLERSSFLIAVGTNQNGRALAMIGDVMRHHEKLVESTPTFSPVVAWLYCAWAAVVWRNGENKTDAATTAADLLLRGFRIITPVAQPTSKPYARLSMILRYAYALACRAAGLSPDPTVFEVS